MDAYLRSHIFKGPVFIAAFFEELAPTFVALRFDLRMRLKRGHQGLKSDIGWLCLV